MNEDNFNNLNGYYYYNNYYSNGSNYDTENLAALPGTTSTTIFNNTRNPFDFNSTQQQYLNNFDVYNQLDDYYYADLKNQNSQNWNSLSFNNKHTWTPSDYVTPPLASSTTASATILTHENINLLRNIENLKRLWQTNNASDSSNSGHIETLNYQNSNNSNSNNILTRNVKNIKRTFADVAKTTTASSSSSSSSSASSSASISPPIYKIMNQNFNKPKKNGNKHQLVKAATIDNSITQQQQQQQRGSPATIFPSSSFESVNYCVKEKTTSFKNTIKQANSRKGFLKVGAESCQKENNLNSNNNSNSNEIDYFDAVANSINVSLRDIKPDSKYGLDSFDFPEKTTKETTTTTATGGGQLRKRNNKNNSNNKRKNSFEIINNNNKDGSEYDISEKQQASSSKTQATIKSSSKLAKKSTTTIAKPSATSNCLNQQQRTKDDPAAKVNFKTEINSLTCYDDIWDCLKEFLYCFSSSIKAFFGFILIAFVILYAFIVDCIIKILQSLKKYFVDKYNAVNYYLKTYVSPLFGSRINENSSSLYHCQKISDTLYSRLFTRFKKPSCSEEMNSVNDLLHKIDEKVNKAKNIFYCEHCSCLHKRIDCDRSVDLARYCSKCQTYHSAKESDLWSEKIGYWKNNRNKATKYYALMDSKVYDVTEMIECRSNEIDFMLPDEHQVSAKLRISKTSPHGHRLNCNPIDNEIKEDNEHVYSLKIERIECSSDEEETTANGPHHATTTATEQQQNGSAKLITISNEQRKKCRKI